MLGIAFPNPVAADLDDVLQPGLTEGEIALGACDAAAGPHAVSVVGAQGGDDQAENGEGGEERVGGNQAADRGDSRIGHEAESVGKADQRQPREGQGDDRGADEVSALRA